MSGWWGVNSITAQECERRRKHAKELAEREAILDFVYAQVGRYRK
jgi:hypothetical protein